MDRKSLKVEKKINADATKIFRAWLNPNDFARWFLSGDGIGIESVTIDPKPGGKFLINMSLDGKILPHEGEYIIIDEPKKLVFTWRSDATENRDTLVTITFEEIKNSNSFEKNETNQKSQTLITLYQEELLNDIQINMHYHGWTSILDSLNAWMDT